MLNQGTFGTIFIPSLLWRGPCLGIGPGTSRNRSQHSTTRLSRRRYMDIIKISRQQTPVLQGHVWIHSANAQLSCRHLKSTVHIQWNDNVQSTRRHLNNTMQCFLYMYIISCWSVLPIIRHVLLFGFVCVFHMNAFDLYLKNTIGASESRVLWLG